MTKQGYNSKVTKLYLQLTEVHNNVNQKGNILRAFNKGLAKRGHTVYIK